MKNNKNKKSFKDLKPYIKQQWPSQKELARLRELREAIELEKIKKEKAKLYEKLIAWTRELRRKRILNLQKRVNLLCVNLSDGNDFLRHQIRLVEMNRRNFAKMNEINLKRRNFSSFIKMNLINPMFKIIRRIKKRFLDSWVKWPKWI